jgi:rhamnogalacturonan endolyase
VVVLVEPTAINGPVYQQSKGYFYWTKTDASGNFLIPNVYAGVYEVHAWKDGFIGEYISNTTLTITPQATVNLGKIEYQTPRFAPTLFEIGYPNRRADEYYHGDNFRQWGLYDLFPTDFPNSIQYYVNSTWRQSPSQWRNDWNYAHVPVDNKSINWTIYFDVPAQNTKFGPKGYIFIAKSGACHCNLLITVNNVFIGTIAFKDNDNSVYRDSIYGINELHSTSFASSILVPKGNKMIFGITCKARLQGIMYDYVRMELDNFQPIMDPLLVKQTR